MGVRAGVATWDKCLDLPAGIQIGYLAEFMRTLPWWRLKPAGQLLAEQPGDKTFNHFISVSQADECGTIVAYVPVKSTVKLFNPLGREYEGEWFNPVANDYIGATSTHRDGVIEVVPLRGTATWSWCFTESNESWFWRRMVPMAGQSAKKLVERAREVIARESEAVRALTAQIDESVAEVARMMFNCKGHILVAGAGTSRAVSQRFAHLLSCCGTPALALNAADCLHGGAGAITGGDILYVISKGGHSREINCLVEIAKEKGRQDHRPHGEPGFAAGEDERCDLQGQGAGGRGPLWHDRHGQLARQRGRVRCAVRAAAGDARLLERAVQRHASGRGGRQKDRGRKIE